MKDIIVGFPNTETLCNTHGELNCLVCEEKALQEEKDAFLETCGSCINFASFHATAGLCKIASCNCVYKNPKAMIDMFDNKCSSWVLDPTCL